MKTEKLYNIAEEGGIALDFYPMPKTLSAVLDFGDKYFIAIDPLVLNSTALERVCLAHELGHCKTGSTYNIYSPLDLRAKHENRANKWAVDTLIPKKDLENAIKKGYRDICSLAEYFSVTEEFMKKAIELYKKQPIK